MQFDNINLDSDFHMGLSIAYSIYMFLKIFWWNMHTSYQKLMLLIQWKYNCYVFVHLDCTFIYLIHFTHTWKHMDVHGVDIWAHNVYWSTCTKPGKHGGCLIRSRNCLPFENTWVHPLFFVLVESVFLIFFVFCVVLLCVFIFWVPCCDVRYDFAWKRCSVRLYLQLLVGGLMSFIMSCYLCLCAIVEPTHIGLCFCFVSVLFLFSSSRVPHVARLTGLSIFYCPFCIF